MKTINNINFCLVFIFFGKERAAAATATDGRGQSLVGHS